LARKYSPLGAALMNTMLTVLASAVVLSAACSAAPAGPQTPSPSVALATASPTAPPTPSPTPSPTQAPTQTPTGAPALIATTVPGDQAPADATLIEIHACCAFDPYAVTVPAGDVSFLVQNGDFEPHNFNIGTERWQSLASTSPIVGGTSKALVVSSLEPGEYIFWCSINSHMNFGMEGTLTVE
jgi:plastocyanin